MRGEVELGRQPGAVVVVTAAGDDPVRRRGERAVDRQAVLLAVQQRGGGIELDRAPGGLVAPAAQPVGPRIQKRDAEDRAVPQIRVAGRRRSPAAPRRGAAASSRPCRRRSRSGRPRSPPPAASSTIPRSRGAPRRAHGRERMAEPVERSHPLRVMALGRRQEFSVRTTLRTEEVRDMAIAPHPAAIGRRSDERPRARGRAGRLRDHRRPREGDDVPLALPARAAGAAALPDRRRRGRRLERRGSAPARADVDRGRRRAGRRGGLRAGSRSGSPTCQGDFGDPATFGRVADALDGARTPGLLPRDPAVPVRHGRRRARRTPA